MPRLHQPERSLSCLPRIRVQTRDLDLAYKSEPASLSAPVKSELLSYQSYLDDLDRNPDSHFLAPIEMYEYEDWASDSDDEGEDVELDAGITDFALFDFDRRRAQEDDHPIPSKWNDVLESQSSALQRAMRRTRADSELDPTGQRSLRIEDIPNLTPDNSPSLRDDLDVELHHEQKTPRLRVPNYLTITITPPEDEQNDELYDDGRALYTARSKTQLHSQSQSQPKPERPGLRSSRTMSGQIHAWREPSLDMYTVGEEPEKERCEEVCEIRRIDSGYEDWNRGRDRRRK